MTPIDIAFWAMIAFLYAALFSIVFGIIVGELEGGVALMLMFLSMAFTTFVIWALLWTIFQLVTA